MREGLEPSDPPDTQGPTIRIMRVSALETHVGIQPIVK